jgi:hypothetical protein
MVVFHLCIQGLEQLGGVCRTSMHSNALHSNALQPATKGCSGIVSNQHTWL